MNVTLRRLSTGESTFSTLSLATYLVQWITTKRALRPTTRRNYESNIKHYLVALATYGSSTSALTTSTDS